MLFHIPETHLLAKKMGPCKHSNQTCTLLSPQNVLELSVCDEDTLTPDDHLLTILYDLTKLCFRKKTHVKFPLNPEVGAGVQALSVLSHKEELLMSGAALRASLHVAKSENDSTAGSVPVSGLLAVWPGRMDLILLRSFSSSVQWQW